jgi:hypothetical protein
MLLHINGKFTPLSREVKIPWVGDSIYHGKGVNIQWIGGSIYHG